MRKLLLAPSMGCCDLFQFEQQVRFIDENADFLHIDIKDGNYAKTSGVGMDFMATLKKVVKKPMDAYLMVKHPQDYIEECVNAGATYITLHTEYVESEAFIMINKIISLGCKAGIALYPTTSLETIRYYLPLLSKVTIYAGQKVLAQMYDKIDTLVCWRQEMGLDFLIEAGGLMDVGVYASLYEVGADIVVLGSSALWNKSENIEKAWDIMQSEITEELKNVTDRKIKGKREKNEFKNKY